MIADIAAGHISMIYGLRGPNYATVSACASSTNAIIDAFNLIRLNKANVIVSGGAEATISAAAVGGLMLCMLYQHVTIRLKLLQDFSASRDGFVIGEGEL